MPDLHTLASYGLDSTYTPDKLFAHDADSVLAKGITLLAGQNLARGTVLGRITTGGKYTISASAAGDGSQVPDAILAEDTDASGGDRNTIAYFSGTFNEGAFILGAGQTLAGIRDILRGKGILTVTTIPV